MNGEEYPCVSKGFPIPFGYYRVGEYFDVIIKADKNEILKSLVTEEAQSNGVKQGESHKCRVKKQGRKDIEKPDGSSVFN